MTETTRTPDPRSAGISPTGNAATNPAANPAANSAANPATIPDAAHFGAWADFILGYTRVMRVVEKELRDAAGITFSQYDVLYNLSAAPEHRLSMAEIGESVLFSTGAVTNLVTVMVDRDLVDRVRADHDRRVVFAHITDHGHEVLLVATTVILGAVKREFTDLIEDDELEPVSRFFARLRSRDHALRQPPYDLPIELP